MSVQTMTVQEAIKTIQARNSKYKKQYIKVADRDQEIIMIADTAIFVRMYTIKYSKSWYKRGYEICERFPMGFNFLTLWELKRLAKQMEVTA